MLCKVFLASSWYTLQAILYTTRLLFIKHHFHQSPKPPKEQFPIVLVRIRVPQNSGPTWHSWTKPFLASTQTVYSLVLKTNQRFSDCKPLLMLFFHELGILSTSFSTYIDSSLNTYYVPSLPIKVHSALSPFSSLLQWASLQQLYIQDQMTIWQIYVCSGTIKERLFKIEAIHSSELYQRTPHIVILAFCLSSYPGGFGGWILSLDFFVSHMAPITW